ncbi:dihydrolipoamide acetyltransferase family protein [Agromyces soli]
MSRDFLLPDLGEGLTEATIVAWLVGPGDEVAVDQPVVELESAKSVVQLPTPFGGIVERLGGEVGQQLHAGDVLLALDGEGAAGSVEQPSAPIAAADDRGEVAAGAGAPAAESGAVLIGYGTSATSVTRRPAGAPSRFGRATRAASSAAPSVPTASSPAGEHAGTAPDASMPAPGAAVAQPALDPSRRSPVVSPIVRRLARANGFDASRLLGSGPEHLVLRRDVEAYLAGQAGVVTSEPSAGATTSTRGLEASAAPAASTPDRDDVRVPLGAMKRAAAQQFTRSRREIPEATVWVDVDATRLVEARRELEAATGERFGITALVARFLIAGLARHPLLNSSFDAERHELVQHRAVHLGTAVQTPRGLLVPVVHDADLLSLRALRDALAGRAAQAADGALPPTALRGGTVTLNNYGALGVDGSAAIINHPEAAMLGIGRLVQRPWVVDGALAVRTVTELTLSFDHRVCDGAEAAGLLTFVARCIEHPLSLLAEL